MDLISLSICVPHLTTDGPLSSTLLLLNHKLPRPQSLTLYLPPFNV